VRARASRRSKIAKSRLPYVEEAPQCRGAFLDFLEGVFGSFSLG
jgi:hypothetical protein